MSSMRATCTMLALWLASAAGAADFVELDRKRAAALTDPAAHRVPTVVALWSLECVHCKKNLARLAALARAEAGVRLITVAVQAPEPGLGEPLERLAVPGERYAYGPDAPEALAYALDPRWRGELPRTLLFDGRGGAVAHSGVLGEAQMRGALGLTVPHKEHTEGGR